MTAPDVPSGFSGSPKAPAANVHPVVGYAVRTACSDSGPPPNYTELDLGFGRGTGGDGGGWPGLKVTYKVGNQQYVLTLNDEIYVCGSAIPDVQARESCIATEVLTPGPTPGGY